MAVGLEFSTLETKALEVADGQKCRDREQRKRHKKGGSLGALAVQKFGQGEQDEGE